MPGRREPGTEPSGVVGGCGKRSPFSFLFFILIGLLDALFAFGAVAGLSLFFLFSLPSGFCTLFFFLFLRGVVYAGF